MQIMFNILDQYYVYIDFQGLFLNNSRSIHGKSVIKILNEIILFAERHAIDITLAAKSRQIQTLLRMT